MDDSVDRYPGGDRSESDSEIWSDSQQSDVEDEEAAELAELADAAAGEVGGIAPYQFEPQFEEGQAQEPILEEGGEADRENRLGNNNWCSCSGGCSAMPTVKESVCCKEVDVVLTVMGECEENANLSCITEHPGFRTVCLDQYVLDTAYYQYRQHYGRTARNDASADERYRHVAYRQMARWCWGYLGRYVRVPLPSCAVIKIHQAFPSVTGEYTGFQNA